MNSEVQDQTALGKLMHDMHCRNADEMYSEILAQRVYELKETEEGIDTMCEEMEKIYSEGEACGEARGEYRGRVETKKNTAKALADKKMPLTEIAEVLGEKEETVEEWLLEKV